MTDRIRIQILFEKYIRRACSPEELREFIGLLKKSESDDLLEEPMRTLWEQLRPAADDRKVDWEAMYAGITAPGEGETRRVPLFGRPWLKVAAAVLVLLGLFGSYRYWSRAKNASPEKVATRPAKPSATKQTAPDVQTIHLPDGSTVTLNTGSKLNYPAAFTGRTREVYLTGEGYFDVRHFPGQPFIVHSGKISVKVLGTAFDIRAYPSDPSIQVTVTRGKVQVLNESKGIGLLTANQQISFSKTTEAYSESEIDTRPVVAWKPDEIVFNDITMAEAAQKIEDRFNVKVRFANPALQHCRITAKFSEDDPMEELLDVICAVTKSTYAITENKITIEGKGCGD